MVRGALLVLMLMAVEVKGQAASPEAETFFELKVRPVLAGTCFKCHGGTKTSSGLRVDSREALIKGGDNGPAIVAGDPDGSLLVQALRYTHEDVRMPPDRRLPDAVAADFADWVRDGAVWPRGAPGAPFKALGHWAFEPVRPASPPPGPGHPIDRFIAEKLGRRGIEPQGRADKRTLIRRVTFDLIGLPPTPDEVSAFLDEDSPGAFARVVDRLLASPHYGERWGRHWLDVARYADTAGDNADYPIPEARLYRDYVIDAFNADKPYNQFVREQIAGDILARGGPPESFAERVIATGFLALSRRYATAPEELWHLTLEDAIETTGRAFLGLTLRCARCHDHKFDPVTQRDYYALYGFFASTQFPYAGSEEFQSMSTPRAHFPPLLPPDVATPRQEAYTGKIRTLRVDVKRLESALAKPQAGEKAETDVLSGPIPARPEIVAFLKARKAGREAARRHLEVELKSRRVELKSLERPGLPPDLPGAYAVVEKTPVDESLHLKGEPGARGPVVKRDVPRFLAGPEPLSIPDGASGRLQLAEWLTRPDHPLTARVMVNRLWQGHFGRGIVASASNLGLRGDEPTHPELLDWLASRFVEGGWSIKEMHRLIVLSETYQRAGRHDEPSAAADPENRGLWRYPRRRLDAESIRDAMLAVSGDLDPTRPGPHPFPPIPQWGWTQHQPFRAVYPTDHRSVYLMTQRLQRHPYLTLFDGPDTNYSTDVRTSSTVPLQALFLMNNPFVRERATSLADRLIAASSDPRGRIELAHSLAWSRPPRPVEVERGLDYVRQYAKDLARAGVPAVQVEREAWTSYARIMLTANEFLYLD